MEGLTIRVAGKTFTGTVGSIEMVDERRHILEIDHPSFVVWSGKIRVRDGETFKIAVCLTPRPGLLTVVFPEAHEFAVVADGQRIEMEGAAFPVVSGRLIEVNIQVKDYLTTKRRLDFAPNEEKVWNVMLVPILGSDRERPWFVSYVSVRMVWVYPGSEVRGSHPLEQARLPNEGPSTTVRISRGFWIGKYEIAQSAG